jgi:hypothetical protein
MSLIITYPDGRKVEVDCNPFDMWNGVEVFLKLFGRLPQQDAEEDSVDMWTTEQLCKEYIKRFTSGDYSVISCEYGTESPLKIYQWCCSQMIGNGWVDEYK